jgi:hypothetical protein
VVPLSGVDWKSLFARIAKKKKWKCFKWSEPTFETIRPPKWMRLLRLPALMKGLFSGSSNRDEF